MIKLFTIVAALLVCISAAPSSTTTERVGSERELLRRPSPINPSVPSDPRPADKITKISDPVEAAKYKRELKLDNVKPQQQPQRIPLVLAAAPTKDNGKPVAIHSRQKRDHEQSVPATTGKPSNTKNSHERYNNEGGTKPHIHQQHASSSISSQKEGQQASTIQPRTLPAPLPSSGHTVKRDIPVPLVPKHNHEEIKTADNSKFSTHESSSTAKSEQGNKNDEPQKTPPKKPNPDDVQVEDLSEPKPNNSIRTVPVSTPSSTVASHPLVIKRPLPVAQLFAKHPDHTK